MNMAGLVFNLSLILGAGYCANMLESALRSDQLYTTDIYPPHNATLGAIIDRTTGAFWVYYPQLVGWIGKSMGGAAMDWMVSVVSMIVPSPA
jgi:hypothetical protein